MNVALIEKNKMLMKLEVQTYYLNMGQLDKKPIPSSNTSFITRCK